MRRCSETFPGRHANGSRPARPCARSPTLAGVSLATVSRVAQRRRQGRGRTSPRRCTRPSTLLGYRRDLTATNLRRADRLVGQHRPRLRRRRQPVPRRRAARRRDVARTRGVLPLVGSSDEDADARARAGRGVPLAPRRRADRRPRRAPTTRYLRADRDAGVALVFVDRPPALHRRRLRALATTPAAPFAATAHLIAARPPPDRLPRRPAPDLHAPPSACAATARRSPRTGSRTTRRSCGWSCTTAPTARRGDGELLAGDDPPTALFTRPEPDHDRRRRSALRALGLHRAVALVGFDDLDARRRGRARPHRRRPGRRASSAALTAELLFARLDGDDGADAAASSSRPR